MASKKEIYNKLKILITQSFDDPEKAFKFFDKNEDGELEKGELKVLIKEAQVSKFLSGIVASKLLDGLDDDKTKSLNWQEFKKATKKLLAEDVA